MKSGSSVFLSVTAALVTLAVAGLLKLLETRLAVVGTGAVDTMTAWWLALMTPAPLVVAVLWGRAAWGDPRTVRLLAAVGGWLAAGHLLVGAAATWQMTVNVAAGIVAGLTWRRGWRLDVALLSVTAVLAPLIVWSVLQLPVREQITAFGERSLQELEARAPAGTDPAELAKAREVGRQRMRSVTDGLIRLFPAVLALGLLGEAALVLLLVRGLGRLRGLTARGGGLPPFARWRLPFYMVWVLVVGIGLLLTRKAPWSDAGLNAVVVAASLLSVQGTAVQYHLSRRLLPPPMLVVFWVLMILAFVPLVVSSVLLGLADQWRDLRRLDPDGTAAGSS